MFGEAIPAVPGAMDWRGFGVVALFLLFAGEKVIAWVRLFRPEKREVTFGTEYVGKEEFMRLDERVTQIEEKVERTFERLRTEMKHDIEALMANGEERAVKLHDRINQVLAAVHELKGRIER